MEPRARGPRLLLAGLFGAALPAWPVWHTPVAARTWQRGLAQRAGAIALALLALAAALWLVVQPLASLMRKLGETARAANWGLNGYARQTIR